MDLKDRIKAFADSMGLSIREFERSCGLTRGNISNMAGALGSDKLAKIIDTHPKLNVYWLLTGNGSMLRLDELSPVIEPKVIYQSDPRDTKLIAALENNINALEKAAESNEELIKHLKKDLEECKERLEARVVAEKGVRTRHSGGAPYVDVPTIKAGKS